MKSFSGLIILFAGRSQTAAESNCLQDKLDEYCRNMGVDDDVQVEQEHESCNNMRFARFDGTQWRCYSQIKAESTLKSCVSANKEMILCEDPDPGLAYCSRNQILLDMVNFGCSGIKIGDLKDSFDLGVFIDDAMTTAADATNLFIGQMAYVKLGWQVTTATAVDFLVDECNVAQEDYTDSQSKPVTGKSVAIIKKNCQSKALGVTPISADKRQSGEYTFSFTSFTIGGTNTIELDAKLTCQVKMCLKTDNTCGPVSAADGDCEVVPGYEYVADNSA